MKIFGDGRTGKGGKVMEKAHITFKQLERTFLEIAKLQFEDM